MRLAVVFLARAEEGPEPVREFVRSYRAHDPGERHRLVVLLKGHGDEEAEALRRELDEADEFVRLPDVGFDIGAYLEATRRLPDEVLCFLNTFSRVEAPDWLAALAAHARRPDVGVVSATASFESQFSTNELYRRARALAHDPSVARHLLPFFADGVEVLTPGRVRLRAALGEERGDWAWLLGRQVLLRSLFPAFPNPHVRTNAFAVKRDLLLRFGGRTPRTKRDALVFESGRGGLSRFVQRHGLKLLVAGRDGRGYTISEWPNSATFRSGGQRNLLVSDNQTRRFESLPPELQWTLQRVSWGDYLHAPGAEEVPLLGVRFPVRPWRVLLRPSAECA